MRKSEAETRCAIDKALANAGWTVQSMASVNLAACRGVAIEEVPLTSGFADYVLFVDGKAAGIVEAKKEGSTLTGFEQRSIIAAAGYVNWTPDRATGVTALLRAWREACGEMEKQ